MPYLYCFLKKSLIVMITSICMYSLTVSGVHAQQDGFDNIIKDSKIKMLKILKQKYKKDKMKVASSVDQETFINVEDKVSISAPFKMGPVQKNCSSKKGFLLIHGLLMDANSLREVAHSLRKKYPCSVIKAILLKGHGTLPSELLSVKYKDWVKDTTTALDTFADNNINQVYLVGHSIGGSLAYKAIETHQDKIKGLILFNPGLDSYENIIIEKISKPISWFVDYKTKVDIENPVRYLSVTMNSLVQSIELFNSVDPKVLFKIPSIQVHVSGDTTIDLQENVSEYCNQKHKNLHQFVIYDKSLADEYFFRKYDTKGCKESDFIQITVPEIHNDNHTLQLQISLSHIDLINKKNKYHSPENYYCATTFAEMKHQDCIKHLEIFTLDVDTDIENLKLRSTLNPLFDEMMAKVHDFISKNEQRSPGE
jgi:esterase/lipase